MKKHEDGSANGLRIYEILLWSGLLVAFLITLGSFLRLLMPGPGL